VIHQVVTSTLKKGEYESQKKEVKEHFKCRNQCSKDIWIEKLAVAQKYEVPVDEFNFELAGKVESSWMPDNIIRPEESKNYDFGVAFPERDAQIEAVK
jgi:hypothetical protein